LQPEGRRWSRRLAPGLRFALAFPAVAVAADPFGLAGGAPPFSSMFPPGPNPDRLSQPRGFGAAQALQVQIREAEQNRAA